VSEIDFDGTLVLEKLAEFDLVDEFLDSVDSDQFENVARLMKRVGIDSQTIQWVLNEMKDSN